ncbi:MAG: AbrB/MazE/SpoVT family DNA-binding domain-containing protein [Nitrososphaerota archaeon]
MTTPFRFLRKAFKIGSSIAVTLPSLWCKALGVKEGTEIIVEAYPDKIVLSVKEK